MQFWWIVDAVAHGQAVLAYMGDDEFSSHNNVSHDIYGDRRPRHSGNG